MTIVEFTPAGGLYHFALQLGEAMAARGVDVELLTGADPELTPRGGGLRLVNSLPTWRPGATTSEPAVKRKLRRVWRALRYVQAWRRVITHVRTRRPDVVQLGDLRFAIDGWYVRRLTRLRPAPLIVDLAHTPLPHRRARPVRHQNGSTPHTVHQRASDLHKNGPLVTKGLGTAYAAVDAVLVLGERSANELTDAWPQVRRVEIIPHGLDSIFSSTPNGSADATEPTALFFGNFDRYKGLDLLLDAFALVRARVTDAKLIVAGSPTADVDVEELRARADTTGGIEIRPGYVAVEDVPALFASSRVVVLPYLSANQSGVAHVAQGFRRPVVVTDVGDLATVTGHGACGIVVPPEDPDALATAIVTLLEDPATAARMGEQGYERVTQEASWDEVASRVVEVYDALVASRDAGISPT